MTCADVYTHKSFFLSFLRLPAMHATTTTTTTMKEDTALAFTSPIVSPSSFMPAFTYHNAIYLFAAISFNHHRIDCNCWQLTILFSLRLSSISAEKAAPLGLASLTTISLSFVSFWYQVRCCESPRANKGKPLKSS